MASKQQVAEATVQALDHAAQAIEHFCVEVEPGTDSGFELNSLEQVVMSVDQLLRAIAGIQTALYVAAHTRRAASRPAAPFIARLSETLMQAAAAENRAHSCATRLSSSSEACLRSLKCHRGTFFRPRADLAAPIAVGDLTVCDYGCGSSGIVDLPDEKLGRRTVPSLARRGGRFERCQLNSPRMYR